MTAPPHIGHDDLLEVTGDDPYVRYAIPRLPGQQVWRRRRAVAWVRRSPIRPPSLTLLGPAEDAGHLVADLVARADLPEDVARVMVDVTVLDAVAARLPLGEGHDWEWMYTVDPPPEVAHEASTVDVAQDAGKQVAALLAVANPQTDARPFARPGQRWVGVREHGGRLVACGAREANMAGYPVLQGISVHPDHRGRGLGLAVTARLTREAIDHVGVSTLGLYADNDVARRLYRGLGYRLGHRWASRRLDR